MHYQIRYGSSIHVKKIRKKPGPAVILFGIAAILLVLNRLGVGEVLMQWILPGDPDVTRSALETMLQQIRQGMQVTQAFTTFCKEIIDNGTLY